MDAICLKPMGAYGGAESDVRNPVDPSEPKWIRTEAGVGYRWVGGE